MGIGSKIVGRKAGTVAGALVGSAALTVGLLGLGTTAAGASPSNAPTALQGNFSCDSGQSGTFVVNSGDASAPVTWNVAHLTFNSGASGIFVPNTFDLYFTFDGQTVHQQAGKGSAPGSTTCDISAGGGDFSLTGSVIGKIVQNG